MSITLAVIASLTMACTANGSDKHRGPEVERVATSGEPRTLRLGFSALPPEQTGDAYVSAFVTAARYADTIVIQRSPPWEEFVPGGKVSSGTIQSTGLETALIAQYEPLQLFFAIDPTDGAVQRTRIANLPASVDAAAGFNDPALRSAFISYAAYVAKNYKPDYMALGVEINMLYERNRAQFDAFVTLYREAYLVAKAANPGMKVFPTFQLEDLEGNLDQAHSPHWEVIDRFRGMMDALAISTYPFLGDLQSAADLRADYYSQLKQHFEGEILISESGFASSPVTGELNVGTEEDQRAFVDRLLADAERSGFSLVVWIAALDPAFASTGPSSILRDIGLRKSDGSNKLAWTSWENFVRRPLR